MTGLAPSFAWGIGQTGATFSRNYRIDHNMA